jgi:hypothetical protein
MRGTCCAFQLGGNGTGIGLRSLYSTVFGYAGRRLALDGDLKKQWPDRDVVAVGELHFSADEQASVQECPLAAGFIA